MTLGDSRSGPNSRLADLGLRAGGVALLAVAAFAMRMLYYRSGPGSSMESGALEFLLAAIGFFASSVGATLLLLGGRIFDQVRISERWAYCDVTQPRSKRRAAESLTAMAGTDVHDWRRRPVPDLPGPYELDSGGVNQGSADARRFEAGGRPSVGSVNRDRQGWSATSFSELSDA